MGNNGWNDFMQSKQARMVLNSLVCVICAFYAVSGVKELLTPESSAQFMQVIGPTGYYVVTIARILVCVWVSIAFARMAYKASQESDDE
ncbi:MAG: hypothetical protein Q4B54_02875 [Coriobacteriales bacterium]|nr:hypothetical protein [Coriobacteriales bacterium]